MKGSGFWLLVVLAGIAPLATAQTPTNEIAVGYALQSSSGSRDAFASQYDLDQGAFVEHLALDLAQPGGSLDRFTIRASGFGGDPWRSASLRLDWSKDWSLRLDYQKRASFFKQSDFDLGARLDDWAITHWNGSLTYDGWRAARLRLDFRDVSRQGISSFPFYGLGGPYVANMKLDEHVQEAGVSLETRTWPVKLLIEQDLAHYTRRSRADVGNLGQPAEDTDPFDLVQLTSPGEDSSTVPTTRLAAVYRGPRFEMVARGLFRRERLDADRNDTSAYQEAGAAGTVTFIDMMTGSADRDASLADVRVGYAVIPALTVRLRCHYEDASSDGSLLGERILRLTAPGGPMDLVDPVSDLTLINRLDKDATAEAEWEHGPLALVVDYHDGSREVDYQQGINQPRTDVTRDARGWGATASLNPSRSVSLQIGFEDHTFERYVFRTDPESARRLWARVQLRPTTRINLSAHGSRESAGNPADEAALHRRNDDAGLALSLAGHRGASVSVSVDWLSLSSDVALAYFAPLAQTGVSSYDTNILTAGVRAALPLGKTVRLAGGALRIEDRGASLPFTSYSSDVRLELSGPNGMEYDVFADSWRYDEARGNSNDYDVTRYGVVLRRRF